MPRWSFLNPPFTWVRWAFTDGRPGEYKMKMRVTDGTGAAMIEEERSPLPDGATGWPDREFDLEGRRIIHLVPGSPDEIWS